MLNKSIQKKVSNATVKLLKKGGQGVLITNYFILTAAHCLEFYLSGGMVLGDHIIEEIGTIHGKLKVGPLAVEPISDIAVLGPLDDQVFSKEVEQYEEFCNKVKPISLSLREPKWADVIPIWVYTHKKTWIKGKALNYSFKKNPSTIFINVDENIEGGTSGSPIVNEHGELVAIVSNIGGPTGITREGQMPLPIFALPRWLYQEITQPDKLYYRMTNKKAEEGFKRLDEATKEVR